LLLFSRNSSRASLDVFGEVATCNRTTIFLLGVRHRSVKCNLLFGFVLNEGEISSSSHYYYYYYYYYHHYYYYYYY
jgi:hypothetical protein